MYKPGQGRSHTPAPANGSSFMKTVAVTTSTTSGQLAAIRNDEPEYVRAELTTVVVRTKSTAACTLDIGTAANGTTSSDNLIDGVSVAASNTIYNNINDGGTNGKTRQIVNPGGYWTVSVASGDANGLVADFYFDYRTNVGGSPPP